MLDNKFVSIDNIYHRQISKGCILCIFGDYYSSSYWYVYEKDKFNLLTIIRLELDNCYKPSTNPRTILKLKAKDIDYIMISNPKNKNNFLKIEVDIPQTFFKNYHENRLTTKLPKYGDILLVEKNFFSYGAFFVLNYEPHNYTYLIYNISSGKTQNIYIEMCKYKTISTKELRREIYNKSSKIRFRNINTNYEIFNKIEEKVFFQTKMNYMFDTGINNACLGLIQLGFLNEPLTSLTGKINDELNIIEQKNNEVLELILNSMSEDEHLEPYIENICDVNENIKNLINNDETFINTYLNEYKYSELNQTNEEFNDGTSISNSNDNKSSSDGDTIDYPECSYDEKYNHYIEDESYDNYCEQENKYYEDESSSDSYCEQQNKYYDDESFDSYCEQKNKYYEDECYCSHNKYIEDIYENDKTQKCNNINSKDSYKEQQIISNSFDSMEEPKYIQQSCNNSYDDQYEKENYENNLDLKVDELYNYFNTIERKLIIDNYVEEITNTPVQDDMPPLIEIEYYEMNNMINKLINDVILETDNNIINDDKEIEQLTNLFNNCKLIDNEEITTNYSSPIEMKSHEEFIINNTEIVSTETLIEQKDRINNEISTIKETETLIDEKDRINNEISTIKETEILIEEKDTSIDEYVTITHDEIEPISRESCSVM